MSRLGDKLLLRLLAFENLLATGVERDVNTAGVLRAFGRSVGARAVFYGASAEAAVSIGPDADVARGARLAVGVRVGAGATIRRAASLGPGVRIGERCTVGEFARLEHLWLDSDSHIETDVLCIGYGTGCIRIGQHSYIGVRNVLDWSDNLVIGDFVHIAGPSTGIWTHSSALQALHGDALANKSRRTTQPVHIANRVYIGGNCTVYPGVTIGSGSIILPNSAVPSDVEPGVLAGGVPARVVRRLQD